MSETLKAIRETVNHHKLQAEINARFAQFLRDTNTSPLDYSERDRLLFQLACAAGYQMGLDKALAINAETLRKELA